MEIWNNEPIRLSKEVFLNKVRSVLVDLYIYKTGVWQYVFRLYKTVFQRELYLTICISKYRTALTRLNLSSHPLGIELGRYPPRISRDKRICIYYNLHDTDDEFHFVLKCTRKQYIPCVYRIRPNMVELLACDENINLVKFAKIHLFCI